MNPLPIFRCALVGPDGRRQPSVVLVARSIPDAILAANTIAHEHPGNSGFEVLFGNHVIYRQSRQLPN
jgi:hypothetical protein